MKKTMLGCGCAVCLTMIQGCAYMKARIIKHQMYEYADNLLIAAQDKSCEEIKNYVDSKRAELAKVMKESK